MPGRRNGGSLMSPKGVDADAMLMRHFIGANAAAV
jgi:hypothetical protein